VWDCISVIEECLIDFAENQNLDKKWSGKGREECNKACRVIGLSPCKLKTLAKTRFVSKVMLFQEILEFAKCHEHLLS
jgi:hypothetical protein